MKRFVISLIALFACASTASAAVGMFGSYIGVDTNGGGNVFYGAQQPGTNFLTSFDGVDLGDFNPGAGDSLLLSGGEALTFKNGDASPGVPADVFGAELQWRVYPSGSPSGSFSAIGLGFTTNQPFNDAAGNNFTGGGDQKWSAIASTPSVLSGLGNGDYSFEVFFRAFTNEGDQFNNNGGANYVANFSIIPEPSRAMLLLIGTIGLVARRRR